MRRVLFNTTVVLLALAATSIAVGKDGQTPIPFTDPFATPVIIRAPGSYVVTRNLAATPAGAAGPIIEIQCNPMAPTEFVSLDLNGFALEGSPAGADPVIHITGDPACNIVIRDGELLRGTIGIEVVGVLRKLVVEDVEIKESTDFGMLLPDVQNFAIRRNKVIEIGGGPGIWLPGGLPKTGVIEDNVVRRTFDGILLETGRGVEISNNRINEISAGPFAGAGIRTTDVRACLISQNAIALVDIGAPGPGPGAGIWLEASNCKIHNNVITEASGEGIFTDGGSTGNLIIENNVTGSGTDGIRIDGFDNHLEQNLSSGNGLWGIYLGPPSGPTNTVRGNTTVGNGGGVCVGPAVPPDFCSDGGVVAYTSPLVDNVGGAGTY